MPCPAEKSKQAKSKRSWLVGWLVVLVLILFISQASVYYDGKQQCEDGGILLS